MGASSNSECSEFARKIKPIRAYVGHVSQRRTEMRPRLEHKEPIAASFSQNFNFAAGQIAHPACNA